MLLRLVQNEFRLLISVVSVHFGIVHSSPGYFKFWGEVLLKKEKRNYDYVKFSTIWNATELRVELLQGIKSIRKLNERSQLLWNSLKLPVWIILQCFRKNNFLFFCLSLASCSMRKSTGLQFPSWLISFLVSLQFNPMLFWGTNTQFNIETSRTPTPNLSLFLIILTNLFQKHTYDTTYYISMILNRKHTKEEEENYAKKKRNTNSVEGSMENIPEASLDAHSRLCRLSSVDFEEHFLCCLVCIIVYSIL